MPDAQAFAFAPPAIPGVGTSGGVTFMLEDRVGKDVAFLAENTEKFLQAARKRPEFALLFTTLLPSVPQLFADVDRDKVLKQGIGLASVYQTLQAFLGGTFVNYFNRFGRVWQVYVQAEGEFRTKADNVGQFYVRNAAGQPVPLSTLVTMKEVNGPEFTIRFNEHRAAQINGVLKPGYSTQQGMTALEEVFAETMPREMGYNYMGMSFQEKVAAEGIPPAAALRLLAAGGVPHPCCPVRELDAALRRPARHAHRRVRRRRRALAPRLRDGRLRPDRPRDDDRPRREERHPHRRVLQGGVRAPATVPVLAASEGAGS